MKYEIKNSYDFINRSKVKILQLVLETETKPPLNVSRIKNTKHFERKYLAG